MRRLTTSMLTPAMVSDVAEFVLPPELTGKPADPQEASAVLRRDVRELSFFQENTAGSIVAFGMIDTTSLSEKKLVSLWNIRVHPDLRGRGIGRLFMSDLEYEARCLGAIGAYLFAVNGAAGFYEALGYTMANEKTGLMGKNL